MIRALLIATHYLPFSFYGLVMLLLIVLFDLPVFAQHHPSLPLKRIVEHSDSMPLPIVMYEGIIPHNDKFLAFYRERQFGLAWREQMNIAQMIEAIRAAGQEGLSPADYQLAVLERYARRQKSEQEVVFFDLLLTDAFFTYSSHLYFGKRNPEVLFPGKWEVAKPAIDLVQILGDALATQNITRALEELKPISHDYKNLKATLGFYTEIKEMGGWPQLPEGPPLSIGSIDGRIPQIRRRLSASGYLQVLDESLGTKYDSALWKAVRMFQRDHGLEGDGVIREPTLNYLNLSVDDYIEKILVNLERHRWLPLAFENQYLRINIPAFLAEAIEADSVVLSMRAILGRPDRMTPVFSSNMRYLVYNPTWTVPPTILAEDALPSIKQNLQYLESHHLRVIDYQDNEIAPDQLPWGSYNIRNFPYILRQDPGSFNALGLVKFEFPNKHKVFLHDTNNRNLFAQAYRALSSGCIRIENPFALAAYLLRNTRWTLEKLNEAVATGETGTIYFQKYHPIHLVYFTAFVEDGRLQIRNDIYGWDSRVFNAL